MTIDSRPNAPEKATFDVVPLESFIRVTGRGFWTVEEIDAHFAELELALDASRQSLGAATVLVDLRDAPVQTAAVTERLGWWTGRLYQAQDRVAIILASSLLKSQMRRIPMAAKRELFLSPMAALTWLTAGLRNEPIAAAA